MKFYSRLNTSINFSLTKLYYVYNLREHSYMFRLTWNHLPDMTSNSFIYIYIQYIYIYIYTVEPRFTNFIRSWRPFVTRNVRKPKICVLSESYTATDALPPILPACHQPLLPACVFVTRDTIRHPRRFLFGKVVREPICSWREAFVNRGSTVVSFTIRLLALTSDYYTS
jgi:hypothetical protein